MTALLLATGCSTGSDSSDRSGGQDDDVASVSDPGGGNKKKPSGGADSASGAPQVRLDTTETEKLEMFQPYLSCLKDNRVPIQRAGGGTNAAGKIAGDPSQYWYPSVDVSKYPAAEKKCGGKRPLPPPELDPKTNPDYLDQFRAQIECLNREGLKVDGLPDGSGWNYRGESSLSAAEQGRIENKCRMEAFGGDD
ncbi:hypothetical protein [Streptomyces shenzhenensis]|uniref:hypothetical protein n=1 Tax=Streptomyces shenzhenensis TaxID=943815 RepID=UPI003680BE8A